MRLDPRSNPGRTAWCVALGLALGGCGAPEEPLSRSRAHLDSYIFKRQQQPLIPHDVLPSDEFGTAIGISSRWAAVGSPARNFDPNDPTADDTGRATVFERKQGNVWKETSQLATTQAYPDARFGSTVAATDDVVVLGAADADPSNAGLLVAAGLVASFAYRNGSWQAEPLLHDPSEAEFRLFGSALAMDDRTLLVGAYGGDQVFAYPRTASGWGEPFTIDSPASPGAAFGYAVALDDPYCLIGAPFADGTGNVPLPGQGRVYVFKRDGTQWILQSEIVRNFINPNDQFGAAIAARNGLMVATVFGDGSAVISQRDTNGEWGSPTAVSPGQAASDSAIGFSAAIGARSSVWIGAYLDDDFKGSVYPFVPNDDGNWQLIPEVSFDDVGWFGYAVASASGALMVGAPASVGRQGAVYVIETSDGSTCSQDADCFSNHCVKGICCNSSCDDPCYSCFSEDKESESADGTCEPMRAGSRARDQGCADRGAESCDTNGLCDGEGACERYPSGTQCGDPFCTTNDLVGASLCDGKGNCEASKPKPCKSYACNDGACQDSCETAGDCAESNYCTGGRCLPKLGRGVPCTEASACLSGFCADGVCCDRACTGKCEACAEPSTSGSCVPLNSGSPPRAELAESAEITNLCEQNFCNGKERDAASMPADADVVCAPAGCVDGVEVAESRCNAAGRCEVTSSKSCGAYACEAAAGDTGRPAQCLASCDTVSDCALDYYCTTDHECRPVEASPVPSSRGCNLSAAVVSEDWSCLGLLTSAITFLGLRRRRPTAREPHFK